MAIEASPKLLASLSLFCRPVTAKYTLKSIIKYTATPNRFDHALNCGLRDQHWQVPLF